MVPSRRTRRVREARRLRRRTSSALPAASAHTTGTYSFDASDGTRVDTVLRLAIEPSSRYQSIRRPRRGSRYRLVHMGAKEVCGGKHTPVGAAHIPPVTKPFPDAYLLGRAEFPHLTSARLMLWLLSHSASTRSPQHQHSEFSPDQGGTRTSAPVIPVSTSI